MTVSYLNKIRPVNQFDPESEGYDYKTALDAGDRPDETKHWGSLDARTGMVLKGRNHPTWDLMVEEETKRGNSIVKSDDGRYYSVKLPSYLSKIKPVNQPEPIGGDTDDFQFSMENNTTLGFVDAVKEDWGTANGLKKKIPIAGSVYAMEENLELYYAADRLSRDTYEQGYWEELARVDIYPDLVEQLGNKESFVSRAKEADKKAIADYLKYIATDKNNWYRLEKGISVLPTWIAEFAMTGGLASLGDDVAVKAGEKLLGSYAKSTAGKLALRTAGWSSGALTRSFGLSTKIGENYTKQMVGEVLGLKEETGWATKAARAWGDVYIEALSEEAGGAITKGGGWLLNKLPFGSKVTGALEKAWMSMTGGTKGEFIRKLSTKAGYSNILGEIGEERLGTILRAITDVDDFGLGENSTMIDRLKTGLVQDMENIFVEIGVLSVPMGAQYIGGKIVNREKIDKIRTELGAKTDEIAKQEESAQGFRDQIQAEIDEGTPDAAQEAETPETPTTEGAEEKTPQIEPQAAGTEVKPTKVKDANLSDEVDSVVGQLVTGRADPSKSSLRQVDVDEDRKILGLDGVPSAERKSQLKDLQFAKDEGYVENAERNANRALSGGEALNRIEAAGARVRMSQLIAEYRVKKKLLEKATEPTAIAALNTEIEDIIKVFDGLSTAVHRSGSEAGRRLAMQKLTIDENYDYVSVATRAKAKRGRALTQKQEAKLKDLTDKLEQAEREIKRLQDEVSDMMARDFLKKGKIADRYKNRSKAQVESDRGSLISQITQLLDEGC